MMLRMGASRISFLIEDIVGEYEEYEDYDGETGIKYARTARMYRPAR
jgi:hypothetical protein